MNHKMVTIIIPAKSDDDELSDRLRALTEVISTTKRLDTGYGLGGENGYGVDFSNDVFSMHPYCWCDKDDCPWCCGCWCEEGASCPWCRGEHRYAEYGALPPNEWPNLGAPNFWYKPSGFRVWWYKWIGRGMEVYGDQSDIGGIFNHCLESLKLNKK